MENFNNGAATQGALPTSSMGEAGYPAYNASTWICNTASQTSIARSLQHPMPQGGDGVNWNLHPTRPLPADRVFHPQQQHQVTGGNVMVAGSYLTQFSTQSPPDHQVFHSAATVGGHPQQQYHVAGGNVIAAGNLTQFNTQSPPDHQVFHPAATVGGHPQQQYHVAGGNVIAAGNLTQFNTQSPPAHQANSAAQVGGYPQQQQQVTGGNFVADGNYLTQFNTQSPPAHQGFESPSAVVNTLGKRPAYAPEEETQPPHKTRRSNQSSRDGNSDAQLFDAQYRHAVNLWFKRQRVAPADIQAVLQELYPDISAAKSEEMVDEEASRYRACHLASLKKKKLLNRQSDNKLPSPHSSL